jgi:hypothetical protein
MAGYVSPIPVEWPDDYRTRPGHVRGTPARIHMFPQANGRVVWCDPRLCRECEREKTWKEGQTHGELVIDPELATIHSAKQPQNNRKDSI